MDRRKFIYGVTAAGGVAAGTPNAAANPAAVETARVNWKVSGFTCITCAVGLEVMVRGLKGITHVKAVWPDNKVTIGYDQHLTTEKTLRDFIAVCGFQVI